MDHWVNPSGEIVDWKGPCVDFDFKIDRAKLTVGSLRCYGGERGVSVTESHWISLEFFEAVSVKDVLRDEAWSLSLLLSLLTGREMNLKTFQFSPVKEGNSVYSCCDLLQRFGDGEKMPALRIVRMRSVFEDVKGSFGDIANVWLNMLKNPDMRQVFKLYGAVKREQLYIGVRFLLLAQALEAYHTACGRFSSVKWSDAEFRQLKKRIKGALGKEDLSKIQGLLSGANNLTFAERLQDIYADAPDEARKIIPDSQAFIEAVRDNRNAYTHHVGKRSHSKRWNEGALCSLMYDALDLLELLFLRDLNAPKKVLSAIVESHKNSIVYDLSQE